MTLQGILIDMYPGKKSPPFSTTWITATLILMLLNVMSFLPWVEGVLLRTCLLMAISEARLVYYGFHQYTAV